MDFEGKPMNFQANFRASWTKNQEIILIGLFILGKPFQEIADELNGYIKKEAHGYDTGPHRSERAVAFKCCNLNLISQETLNEWDNKRKKYLATKRQRDLPETKSKVLVRDKNKCVLCDNIEGLNFSHIIPFRQTLLNIEVEAITLCNEHHKMFDDGENEITKVIFQKMCGYYPDYKEQYSLIESPCSVHGKHVKIERGIDIGSKRKEVSGNYT